jgi:hypothetical protein
MLLEHLDDLIDEEAAVTERNRKKLTSIPNARQISRRSAAAIKRELEELSNRSNKTGATRESLRSLLDSTASSASSTRSTPNRISDKQIKQLESAVNLLVHQVEAGAPQQPATRVLSDADRRRIEKLQERIAVNNHILARPVTIAQTGGYDVLRQEIRDYEAEIRSILQASAISAPHLTQGETENAVARAAVINDRIDQIDEALATQPGRGMANLLGMQRRTLENARASTIDPVPPQSVMVGVPDPVLEDGYLNNLRQAEQEEEERLTRLRAGRSMAAARRNLEHLRGLIRDRQAEVSRLTPSSEPAPDSVPQSIPVPGTETQVPLSAVQRMMEVQGRLIDRLDHERRLSGAPAFPLLDLRQDPTNPTRYVPRNVPFETQRGRQALEARTASEGADIDREQAELQVARSRIERLAAAISSKITPDVIKEEQTKFARMAEEAAKGNRLIAQSEAARLKKSKGPPVNDLRAAAKHAFMPPATARRLNEEADIRVNKAPAIRQELAEPAPGIATGLSDLELETSVLQRIARNPDSLPGTVAILNEELARREDENRAVRAVLEQGPADTAQSPPPSNPPEPQSERAISNPTVKGEGLQHVTAATFPSGKWTTASSLRWLRSNGLHPIRKSTKINGAYSYALQSPAGYSSFNSVKMSHKNKDFTIVYGTPK